MAARRPRHGLSSRRIARTRRSPPLSRPRRWCRRASVVSLPLGEQAKGIGALLLGRVEAEKLSLEVGDDEAWDVVAGEPLVKLAPLLARPDRRDSWSHHVLCGGSLARRERLGVGRAEDDPRVLDDDADHDALVRG